MDSVSMVLGNRGVRPFCLDSPLGMGKTMKKLKVRGKTASHREGKGTGV